MVLLKEVGHKMIRKMKKIYIILTYSGTMLSRIIKAYTKDEFSHVSIALDKNLKEMYSFGRLRPYNPFYGGFVHEEIDSGTFKRFSNTKCSVYSLEISPKQYYKIARCIRKFKRNRKKYHFNIVGLVAVAFGKKIQYKQALYCAEFVKYVLEEADLPINLPELVRPINFKDIEGLTLIYKGYLRKYNAS